MANVFFDSHRRLRNGWWMLLFLACIAVTAIAYRPLSRGLKELGVDAPWLEPLPFLLSLLAAWVCLRLRGERLASLGFRLDRRWWREIAGGALLGAAAMLVVAGLAWASGGLSFTLDPHRSLQALGYGGYVFLFVALLEENLYRGFLFQRFVDGAGVAIAQVTLGLLFAVAHWGNPGMAGAVKVWATIDTTIAALMLGLAYLRTRSLALPIGLHLGWNLTQGSVLGFAVSGEQHAGWLRPTLQGRADWLTGGSFGPEASVFAVVVDLALLVLLWRWKGTAREVAGPTSDAPLRPLPVG